MINNRWIIDDFHQLSIGFSDLLIDWIGLATLILIHFEKQFVYTVHSLLAIVSIIKSFPPAELTLPQC